jgi:Porin subfamily
MRKDQTMDDRVIFAPMRRFVHAVVGAAAIVLTAIVASGVVAQTLSTPPAPKAPPKSPPPAKSAPLKGATSCSIYGEGFVRLPGSDTCVKVGGYVRTEAGASR